jgi:hypothetical protein
VPSPWPENSSKTTLYSWLINLKAKDLEPFKKDFKYDSSDVWYKKIIFAKQNLKLKSVPVIETTTVSEKIYLAKKQAEYSLKTNNLENGIHYGEGYKQAKNKFFTTEQVLEAIDMARVSGGKSFFTKYTKEEIIESIKKPKIEITFDENNKPIKTTLL